MDLVLRYLENAAQLKRLAAIENDPKLKAELDKQAEAYRKLAEKRAQDRKLSLPDKDV